jgi:ABC-2 type transport system permease protein
MAESKLDTVLKREFLERVRSRWFVVATILGPVLMAFMMFLPSLMQAREQGGPVARVRILDASPDSTGGAIAAALSGGIAGDASRAQWEPVASSEALVEAEARATRDVLTGAIAGYLVLAPDVAEKRVVRYAGRNTTALLAMSELEESVNRALLRRQLEGEGLSTSRASALSAFAVRLETERLTERGRGGSGRVGVLFALGVAITLYLTIFMHGANVMRGVLEEKQSRVAEVVLSSVPSDTLLFGKVLGIGAVGFLQMTIWAVLATVLLAARAPLLALVGVRAAPFTLPELSPELFVVILFSFLLGFLFYAALFAAVGALVSTEQDAQQAQLPVVLLLVMTLALVQGIVVEPDGALARLLTILPFSSPIVLPLRLSLAPVPFSESGVSLVLLVLATITATLAASRIYRVGVLMYGKRPSLREAWRWAKRG